MRMTLPGPQLILFVVIINHRTVTHSAVLVCKGLAIYKQANLTKWRYIKIKMQMLITSRNPKQGNATK